MNTLFTNFNGNNYTNLLAMWHQMYIHSIGLENITDDEYDELLSDFKDFKGNYKKLANYFEGTEYVMILYIAKCTSNRNDPLFHCELLVDEDGYASADSQTFDLSGLRVIKYYESKEGPAALNRTHHRVIFSNSTMWNNNMVIRGYIYKKPSALSEATEA